MQTPIDDLISRAHAAQRKIANGSQADVDEMVAAIAWETYKMAEEIAELAIEETQMGVYEHKLAKHQILLPNPSKRSPIWPRSISQTIRLS
jgi:acyl-CoA reductase-like NAD-dependent aldehyde dehydrogenase